MLSKDMNETSVSSKGSRFTRELQGVTHLHVLSASMGHRGIVPLGDWVLSAIGFVLLTLADPRVRFDFGLDWYSVGFQV